MKKLFIGSVLLSIFSTFNSSFALDLNVNDIVNQGKAYQCKVWSDKVLTYQGEGRIVIDEDNVTDLNNGEQFSTARVVFTKPEGQLAGHKITMNLFHIPENGAIDALKIGRSSETHMGHLDRFSWETIKEERNQKIKDNTILLIEGSETSKVTLTKNFSGIQEFQARQVLGDRIIFGLIPRKISDFQINCVANDL